MPSRRPTSTNGTGADNGASATSTPKRMMRSYRVHQMNTAPGNTSSAQDELSIEVETRNTTREGVDEEVVLDEIVVVSTTPKNAKSKDLDSRSQAVALSAETPRLLRRTRRASSISQGGSAAPSPSGRGVTIKKQDFPIGIAADDDGKPDELLDPPITKRRKIEPKPTQRVAFRKSRSKWDNPDEMLTDPSSPLVNANLRDLVCNPKAWDILTREEREKILAKFPDDTEILDTGTPNARPDIAALRNNNNFRNDVARYQEGLSKGFHDPEWIQQAQAAHRSRELGFYDEFMATDFEEKWDMPMPQQPHAGPEAGGNSSGHTGDTSEGAANDAPIVSEMVVPSEEKTDQDPGTSGMAEPQPADMLQEYSSKINVQDQKGDLKDTIGGEPGHAGHVSEDEYKGDQLRGSNNEQAGPTQVEAVTTQNSTESDGQKIEDRSHDAKVSSAPTLPAVTEGTEKPSEINVIQQVDAAEDAGKHTDTNVPAPVAIPQPIECPANGPQEHQDGNAPSKNEAVEHQRGDK
ncbi:Asx homology domain-containing protein [Xylaria telfairii]|nr:Asx homology domain-containing protein [Xylaria telfairii]